METSEVAETKTPKFRGVIDNLLSSVKKGLKETKEKKERKEREAQAKAMEKKKSVARSKEEYLAKASESLLELRSYFSRREDLLEEQIEEILQAMRQVFHDTKEDLGLNDEALVCYATNFEFLKRVEKVCTIQEAKRIISQAAKGYGVEKVPRYVYDEELERNQVIWEEWRKRKEGKSYHRGIANDRTVQFWESRSREKTEYFIATHPLGFKIIAMVKAQIAEGREMSSSYKEAVLGIKRAETLSLEDVFLRGKKGLCILSGLYKHRDEDGYAEEGQEYSILFSNKGDGEIRVDEVIPFGRKGFEDYFSRYKGETYAFEANEVMPFIFHFPQDLRRFVINTLKRNGWEYPDQDARDAVVYKHRTGRGGLIFRPKTRRGHRRKQDG